MILEKIRQRQEMMEDVLGVQSSLIEWNDQENESKLNDFLPLGRMEDKLYGIELNLELTKRERQLLEHLSNNWIEEDSAHSILPMEQLLANWLQKSILEGSHLPFPEKLRNLIDWELGWLPLAFTISQAKNELVQSQELHDLRDLLKSYLSPQTMFLLINNSFLLCLVPEKKILENRDLESGAEELTEWLNGLYDLCQNELPEMAQMLYHHSLRSPEELILRVGDLLKQTRALEWSLPIYQPIAPWQTLLIQVIEQLPQDERTRIIGLYQQRGTLQLLEQKDWYTTLSVFFKSNLNIASASKELYVHRNTLIYRLDRIASESGLDPRVFKDAVLLQIYLLLQQKEHFDQNNQRVEK